MVLSPALNIRSARGPLYDADALAFCRASGATERKAISDFVRGVKALGLWNNMVCWPLRSTQNSGGADPTNTTVYSLGGLGTFNGTRVNGPTWGTSGVTFANTSSQKIALPPILPDNSSYTSFGVAQLTNVAAERLSVITTGNARGANIRLPSNGSTQLRIDQWDVTGLALPAALANGPVTSMFGAFAAGDASSAEAYINGSGTPYRSAAGDYRLSSAGTSEQIGANRLTSIDLDYFNGVIAAGAFWNQKLTGVQVGAVYTLYKQTLGTGLGLP